jgi:hypothetical protein
MKAKLTKIIVGNNCHSYVADDAPCGLYGQTSRCVMQFTDGRWSVERREGARFSGRTIHDTAREALLEAKQGGHTYQTQHARRGATWPAAMAANLYDCPSGALDALQNYIDRCVRRGIRPNVDKFINMGSGETVTDVRADLDVDPYLHKPLNLAAAA